LEEQHRIRIQCAEEHLPFAPLRDHGVGRLVEEVREELEKLFAPELVRWLPNVCQSEGGE
jgi:hypothetical protein